MTNISKQHEFIEKNIIRKRDNKLDLLFKDLEELINNYKYLFNASGKNHLLNCDKSISKYSKSYNRKLCQLS